MNFLKKILHSVTLRPFTVTFCDGQCCYGGAENAGVEKSGLDSRGGKCRVEKSGAMTDGEPSV